MSKPLSGTEITRVLELHSKGKTLKEIASVIRRSTALIAEVVAPDAAGEEEVVESESGAGASTSKKQVGFGCDVLGCPNRKDDLDSEGVQFSFFLFPKDVTLKKAWEAASKGGTNWKSKSTSRICHQHFLPEDFSAYTGTEGVAKRLLKDGTVPSVKLPPPKEVVERRPLVRTVRRTAAAIQAGLPAPKRAAPSSPSSSPPAKTMNIRKPSVSVALPSKVKVVTAKAKNDTPARPAVPTGDAVAVDPAEYAKEVEDWRYYQKLEEERQSSIFLYPQAVEEAQRIQAENHEGTSFRLEEDRFVFTRVWFEGRDLRCRHLVVQNDSSVLVWENGLKYAGHKVFDAPGTVTSGQALRHMVATLPELQLGTTQDVIHLQGALGLMIKKLKANNVGDAPVSAESDESVEVVSVNVESQKESADALLRFLEFSAEQLTLLSWPKHGRRFSEQAPVTLSLAVKLKQYSAPGYEWLKNTGPIVFPCGVTVERDSGKYQDDVVYLPHPSASAGRSMSAGLRVTVAVPHAFPALRPSPERQDPTKTN